MLFYITIAPFASTVNWWVLIYENLKNLKRHPFFQGCLMLPRMSGWRSLNQANRNGRIRTSIAPQRVINCAALPIKLHPITDAQQGGTRRHTHFPICCMPLASGYTITFWKRKTGKNGKTYAAFIKFSYSFLTLSAVARLPILIATSPLLFESLFRKSRKTA